MTKYLILFRDGESGDREKMIQSWDTYIGRLAREGKFVSGLPFGPNAKLITGPEQKVEDFVQGEGAITGYLIVRANTLEEAVELGKQAPNLLNGGSVEVRSTIPPVQ